MAKARASPFFHSMPNLRQKQLQIRKARLRSIPKTSHSNKFRIIREIYTVLKYEEATIQIQTKASTTAETIAN